MVSWSARKQLPGGRVIELKVRDSPEGGVGLTGDEHVPAHTVVNFALDVPPLIEGGQIASGQRTIKTTYTVVHGSGILCGDAWVRV